jgi:hypothetical protein
VMISDVPVLSSSPLLESDYEVLKSGVSVPS